MSKAQILSEIPKLSHRERREIMRLIVEIEQDVLNGQNEPQKLQRMMDEAEASGFKKMTARDWNSLRRLAKSGLAK